ncbi:MAG: hypothetical protein WC073_09965 [Sterolibacterium sp.]
MAIRIRSSFHSRDRQRTPQELASVAAMLGWKLAIDSIKRLREASFEIDLGHAYFDFVCEYLAFLAHAADRVAHRDLSAERRQAFTQALVLRLAEVIEDNAEMRLVDGAAGECRSHFIALYNLVGEDYAQFEYAADGPDFGFRRCFAARVRELMPEKDRLWTYDQLMEVEIPEAIKALEKTLPGMFAAAAQFVS